MKALFTSFLRVWPGCLAGLACAGLALTGSARAGGFVYETATEFLASGDFNGDGIPDVLVVDKLTGNARVGYQDAVGQLTWAGPATTGVSRPGAIAVGRFLDSTLDAVALTSPELNNVNLVGLADANNVLAPVTITPSGVGLALLIGMPAPFGAAGAFDFLLTGSNDNDLPDGAALLELFGLAAGAPPTQQGSQSAPGPVARGNALNPGDDPATLAAMLQRGTNDQFQVFAPNAAFAQVLTKTNLASGTEYVFGLFDGETMPRFFFYVPGQSNLVMQALVNTATGYDLGLEVPVTLDDAVERVYYVPLGADGTALIQFGDGVRGLTVSGGVPALAPAYRSGAGGAGARFSGVVPLADGKFALLDAPAGGGVSSHGQVVQFDGANYTQLSSGDLTPVTRNATRANVWVFRGEPFVSRTPGLVASLNAADWSVQISGLPAGLSVLSETDGGPGIGLGNDVSTDLGAPPTGTVFALAEQYREDISIFTYSAPQAADPLQVTIAPPPGNYAGPVSVSLVAEPPSDHIFYRPTGGGGGWRNYTLPFTIGRDTTVEYYAIPNSLVGRSRLESARYAFAAGGTATPQPAFTLNPPDTNAVSPSNPALVQYSSEGTVFYGRKSSTNFSIWAINLDGTGDRFITTGSRPRASRDGKWLAFLRRTTPPPDSYGIYGDLWVRDLGTGDEMLLYSNATTLVGMDWDRAGTRLFFDNGCGLQQIDLTGAVTPVGFPTQCNQYAPAVSPVDGRVAFFDHSSGGVLVTTPDLVSVQTLPLGIPRARWPAWSPDGAHFSLVDPNTYSSLDIGHDIYVAGTNGTPLSQITAFLQSGDGFPHGTLWAPGGNALVGAGTIFGTNGLWVIPLTADLTACDCLEFPTRLPTTVGDPIDFAGTVVVAPPLPQAIARAPLAIRVDPDAVVVYWGANFANYTLESTLDLNPPTAWTPILGPYAVSASGFYFEYRESLGGLSNARFFRLRYTGP